MTDAWKPVFALPSVDLDEPIEHGPVAIVPADDARILELIRNHPSFEIFLARFTDNFGVKFKPPIFMIRSDALPKFFTVDAIASFRDAVAISTVCQSRSLELCYSRGHRVMFGNAFEIYPWMIDKDYEYVIGQTPALLGLHEVSELRAQSSPLIFRQTLRLAELDRPMLTAILDRWSVRCEADTPDWRDIALFRSLNMASMLQWFHRPATRPFMMLAD